MGSGGIAFVAVWDRVLQVLLPTRDSYFGETLCLCSLCSKGRPIECVSIVDPHADPQAQEVLFAYTCKQS